ncbi:hypothetical protein LARI1_G001458 [Lachnellula arida]|uniref:Uncharacterized protein n=1 Tax=Lachnellula arida TaxID=1316785 RepID=A0A8T9BPV3_9HELO|nr:hypothetical protein LARI1_G001458 [Lachnellula arida]
MHISSFTIGLLLPLLAIAQSDSSTLTLTTTLRSTHTITVSQVVASVTSTFAATSSSLSSSSSTSSSSSSSATPSTSFSSFNSTLVAGPTAIMATASSPYKIPTTGTGSPRVSGTGAPVATSSIPDNFIGAASSLNGMYAGGVGVVVMIAAAML